MQEMTIEECFRILELNPCASFTEVKESWRLLSQIWHPDKHNPGTKVYTFAEQRQLLINNAYDRLKQCLEVELDGVYFPASYAQPAGYAPRSKETTTPNQEKFCAYKRKSEYKPILASEFGAVLQKAKAGDADAQFMLGVAYELGLGGAPMDLSAAAHWYERATKACNHQSSMHRLGYLFLYGLGVAEDIEQGLRLWKSAALHNHVDAQMDLARAYEVGEKSKSSAEESRRWYAMAARNGDEQAAMKLAELPATKTFKRTG